MMQTVEHDVVVAEPSFPVLTREVLQARLDAYPTCPEACAPTTIIGRLVQARTAARDAYAAFEAKRSAMNALYRRHVAIVDRADEGSDFAQIATSMAAVKVLEERLKLAEFTQAPIALAVPTAENTVTFDWQRVQGFKHKLRELFAIGTTANPYQVRPWSAILDEAIPLFEALDRGIGSVPVSTLPVAAAGDEAVAVAEGGRVNGN